MGDSIMCMPAVVSFMQANPDVKVTVLAKKSMKSVWAMFPERIEFMEMPHTGRDMCRLASKLRKRSFDAAYILPNSVRSALIPWMAGIPLRIGAPGHARRWLINRLRPYTPEIQQKHQAYEAFHILCPENAPAVIHSVSLRISDEEKRDAMNLLAPFSRPLVGLIPGAARGTSKQWAPERYAAVAQYLCAEGGSAVLFGTPAEASLCGQIAATVNSSHCQSFAGTTSFALWAALMAQCDAIVANDSGGMHLASALGCSVIAVYGITDPQKTGPLGDQFTVLQHSRRQQRDVPRESEEATAMLALVSSEEVIDVLRTYLGTDQRKECF